MSENIKHKIFTSTDCISEQMMFDYIDGKLNSKEQHFVEKHLLDCELCSDALEGLQLTKDRSRIRAINKAIYKNISGTEGKVISINFNVIMSIAAGFLLLIGGIFFFKHFVSDTLNDKKEVSELKVQPEKEAQKYTSPPINKDSLEPLNSKNEIISNTEKSKDSKPVIEDKSGLEDKEEPMQKQSEQLLENDNAKVDEVTVTNEVTSTNAPRSAAAESNYKAVPDENLSLNQTIAFDKAGSKDNNNRVDSKNEESITETGASEGYYAKEQTLSKNATKSSALKSEAKKKEKLDRRENQERNVATGNVAYAPSSVSQMDADQTAKMDSVNIPEEPVYTIVEEMPKYPGGEKEMMNFIHKHFVFPKETKDYTGGTIYLQFIIDKEGSIKNPKIIKGLGCCSELEKEAIRVVSIMPKWIPGKLKGTNVSVLYNLPYRIELK